MTTDNLKPKAPAPLLPGMSNFDVTRGDGTRQIQAANKREALRRFDNDDQRVEAKLVKGDERIPGLLPSDGSALPAERRYKVTWGPDEKTVTAVHKDDAWTQFVGGDESSQAWKFPNLYERLIEDLGPVESDKPKADGAKAESDHEVKSPVADESAADAVENIGRMRSPEKLQEVIAADKRHSVVAAAQRRLNEIGG